MTKASFEKIDITNPKRITSTSDKTREELFPYYAGYSPNFASRLLSSLSLGSNSIVLDPWNGGGTTTQSANRLGIKALGVDLNPTMVIVAKASLLSSRDFPSLAPLAQSLVERATSRDCREIEYDPLSAWFYEDSLYSIRRIELEINRTLISHD